MNKLLLIGLLFTACQSGANKQVENWRRFFASDKSLSNGYVKKTSIESYQGTLIYYDKVFLEQDKIKLHRFDNEFNKVREDVNEFDSEKMVLTNATYYYAGIGAVKAKIIEPTIAPYKPTKEILRSHLEFSPFKNITFSTVTEAKYQGNEVFSFNGEDVNCIKFSYNEEYKITNEDNPTENTTHKSIGYSLWGEDIGLLYMKFEDQRGITEFRIEEILTLEEFEKLKQ